MPRIEDFGPPPPKEPTPDLSDEREWTISGLKRGGSGRDRHGILPTIEPSLAQDEVVTVVPKSRLSALSAENEELRAALSSIHHVAYIAQLERGDVPQPLDALQSILGFARSALAPNTPEEDS